MQLGSGDDNFAPLTLLRWQVHVYGEVKSDLQDACLAMRLSLHVFPWRETMRRAGLQRGALYLVRPDGYVALADPGAGPARLRQYFSERGARST